MSEQKPRELRLDDVTVIKKENNCPDCKVRVETYLKSVNEWQFAYEAVCKERDESFHAKHHYAQLQPAISQMGGWANFRHWILKHAAEYFETCKRLEEERDKLRAELEHLNRTYADEHSGDCDIPAVKHLRWENTKLRADLAVALEALEYVANEVIFEPTDALKECAQEALAKLKGNNNG